MYDTEYFRRLEESSSPSARAVFPLVRGFINFSSVVDVGCGSGAWLAASGVSDFLGVDGYAEDSLLIDRSHFLAHDLTKPLQLERRFDLAMSLEVAEHLPESCADNFIQSLCSLSDAVLFSAAVPGQGGTGHINEQWPEYWQRKFRATGFRMVDCFREQIWNEDGIAPWYRQNIFLVLRFPEELPSISPYLSRPILPLVHPAFCKPPSIRQSFTFLQNAVRARILRQMK